MSCFVLCDSVVCCCKEDDMLFTSSVLCSVSWWHLFVDLWEFSSSGFCRCGLTAWFSQRCVHKWWPTAVCSLFVNLPHIQPTPPPTHSLSLPPTPLSLPSNQVKPACVWCLSGSDRPCVSLSPPSLTRHPHDAHVVAACVMQCGIFGVMSGCYSLAVLLPVVWLCVCVSVCNCCILPYVIVSDCYCWQSDNWMHIIFRSSEIILILLSISPFSHSSILHLAFFFFILSLFLSFFPFFLSFVPSFPHSFLPFCLTLFLPDLTRSDSG